MRLTFSHIVGLWSIIDHSASKWYSNECAFCNRRIKFIPAKTHEYLLQKAIEGLNTLIQPFRDKLGQKRHDDLIDPSMFHFR